MQNIFLLFSLTIFGLVFGSFISALSYRSIKGISIFKGRSICPHCKKKIGWRDNIPVFSFFFLNGRSRCCKKLISLRYPLIEFFTMLTFLFTGLVYINCGGGSQPICQWKAVFGVVSLPHLILVSIFMITLFVTDFEHKLILDKFVFIPFLLTGFLLIFFNPDQTYTNLFLSFATASFFLLIHLGTRGKGMGLGDVKLVLLPPLILGWPYTLIWLFLSFTIGAFIGVLLILLKKAKFGKHIPFGPFLILAYFLVLFWGEKFLFILDLKY